MNAITAQEVEIPASGDILTIEPAEYVAAVYAPFRAELALAITESAGVSYDLSTAAGMSVAIKWRAKFRDLRLRTKKAHQTRKAPAWEICKMLDSGAKEITGLSERHETKFDGDIKTEEARREAEKQRKLTAERERREAIEAKIAVIRDIGAKGFGRSSGDISALMGDLSDNMPTKEVFAEYLPAAQSAHSAALGSLGKMFDVAQSMEQEAMRIQAEREELEHKQAEHAAEVERQRLELDRLQREAAAKREAERIEAARIDSIKLAILDIQSPLRVTFGKSATELQCMIKHLAGLQITAALYGEFVYSAEQARNSTIEQLESCWAAAANREAESAELKRQQDELAEQQRVFNAQQSAAAQAEGEARRLRELPRPAPVEPECINHEDDPDDAADAAVAVWLLPEPVAIAQFKPSPGASVEAMRLVSAFGDASEEYGLSNYYEDGNANAAKVTAAESALIAYIVALESKNG